MWMLPLLGKKELFRLAIIFHEEKSLVLVGGIPANQKQKFMIIHFMHSTCVSSHLFSRYSGICFRHFLPGRLGVSEDECDCPLCFSLLVLPNIDWFSLSPVCDCEPQAMEPWRGAGHTSRGALVLFLLVTHTYCAFWKYRLLSLDFEWLWFFFKAFVFFMIFFFKNWKDSASLLGCGNMTDCPTQMCISFLPFYSLPKERQCFPIVNFECSIKGCPEVAAANLQ